MILHSEELVQLETRYRANLINSLGGFKSLVLIGTKSESGNENLATFSSLFHLGANPALTGIIIRPGEAKQNTLGNIMRTGQYTINHVLPSFYKKAHQCAAKYDPGISEFDTCGLTPFYEDGITAPFVQESKIRFACELVQKTDIELNGTFFIIGKIIHIELPEQFIQADGYIDLEAAGTVTCSGLDSYHATNRLARLSYPKTDKAVTEIPIV